ncbi:hypothetical protein HYDPIDRAFT_33234 [Hydnomerulius pinastri MD-312]|uniref:Uncharacterized protein n=1 Tax=Hydnomerulius pinastri MD-312 TaxID=994086 RepID=A0A0C9VNW8_9AGAM|nr:hypothetical protein HYDPIDRAFT_33234 [Hydnomerulius pinastri MD-312]
MSHILIPPSWRPATHQITATLVTPFSYPWIIFAGMDSIMDSGMIVCEEAMAKMKRNDGVSDGSKTLNEITLDGAKGMYTRRVLLVFGARVPLASPTLHKRRIEWALASPYPLSRRRSLKQYCFT